MKKYILVVSLMIASTLGSASAQLPSKGCCSYFNVACPAGTVGEVACQKYLCRKGCSSITVGPVPFEPSSEQKKELERHEAYMRKYERVLEDCERKFKVDRKIEACVEAKGFFFVF